MIPQLIGISGKAGAGKDTLGYFLKEKIGQNARIDKFANLLKKVAGDMLNVPPSAFESTEFKKRLLPAELQVSTMRKTLDENTKPMWTKMTSVHDHRWFLQQMGTEVAKTIHPDFWVWAYFNTAYDPSKTIILTDVRFPNEADQIKERGGIVIRVNNDRVKPMYLYDTPHISETALDNYDFNSVIQNNTTLADLGTLASALIGAWTREEAA